MTLQLAVGLCNLLTFVIFLPLNGILIWVIYKNNSLNKHWAYRIIAHIAVSDVIDLIILGTSGFLSVFNLDSPSIVAKTCYSLSLGFKITEAILCFILGLNRFFVLVGLGFLNKGFVYTSLIVVGWTLGVVVNIFVFCNLPTASYNLPHHHFDGDFLYQQNYTQCVSVVQICIFSISALIYISIGFKLKCQKPSVPKNEVRLFVQAMLPFAWFLAAEMLFNLKSSVEFNEELFAILFMFFSRYVPVVHIMTYLLLNLVVRNEILIVLGINKKITVRHS